jgi:hypothetical protein
MAFPVGVWHCKTLTCKHHLHVARSHSAAGGRKSVGGGGVEQATLLD